MTESLFRSLPSVDRVLRHELLKEVSARSPGMAVALTRRALEEVRRELAQGGVVHSEDDIAGRVLDLAREIEAPSLRPVINATGVILQTNLGRAPLSRAARAAMDRAAAGYSNLEFDLEEGRRGSRYTHLKGLLREVTGAELGIVVNNNASALLLVLSALANGRGVVISRGQAVEIGGGFRIPEVMAQSGAILKEIGTTNRTYLRDYERGIGAETAAIMRVHASNYRIVGFTEQPGLRDMVRLAHEHGLLMIDDIGSGCLVDVRRFGLAPEPTVQESLAAGADLCLFSGDKLLGGPQAGIVAGRSDLIEQLERHPLARALRVDKATIAALHATLLHYLRGEELAEVPVWRMISTPVESIERRARSWADGVGQQATVVDSRSMVGGGSLPEETLPTRCLSLEGDGDWVMRLARRLRTGDPAVVARVHDDALLLDPRTVGPSEDKSLIQALKLALKQSVVS